ncbi:MAG: AMP-binding protein [Acidobacteriota bacterium]
MNPTELASSAPSLAETVDLTRVTTLNQALLQAMDVYGQRHSRRGLLPICFRLLQADGRWRDLSYRHFRHLALTLAHGFERCGLAAGMRVALVGDNDLDWLLSYVACLFNGATIVPLSPALPPELLHFIVRDAEAHWVITDDALRAHFAADGDGEPDAAAGDAPPLRILTFGHGAPAGGTGDGGDPPSTITALLRQRLDLDAIDTTRKRALAVPATQLATLQYTRVEGGRPRGAMFRQMERLASLRSLAQWMRFDDDDLAFTVTPWSDAIFLDATLHYFVSGMPNALGRNRQVVFDTVQQASPTLVVTTPNALERVYNEIIVPEIARLPESSQRVFDWALATAKHYRAAGDAADDDLRDRHRRADMTFFSAIRGRLGGRFRRFYVTGASLSDALRETLDAIGLPVYVIYSLTEAGGMVTAVDPARPRRGCGPPAPDFEVRLDEDSEVRVRGPAVMRGYWAQEAVSQRVLDDDGWLRTGDLGEIDDDGTLAITGRKRAVMVLSTGHKVSPEAIESALVASPSIAHAAVIAEGRPYVSALLVPALDALIEKVGIDEPHADAGDADAGDGASDDGREGGQRSSLVLRADAATANPLPWIWRSPQSDGEDMTTHAHPKVQALVDQDVARVNVGLDRWRRIVKYVLVEQEQGETARLFQDESDRWRPLITQRYARHIDALYPRAARHRQTITRVQVGPERLQELLEKERILNAWMSDAGIEYLLDLARRKSIDATAMVHICDTVAGIAQMENESRPLSTALIIGDPARIARELDEGPLQLLRHEHIRRTRRSLVRLATMVDGDSFGYVVDPHGYVRGIRRLPKYPPEGDGGRLFGPRFRQHAQISERAGAMVFYVPSGGHQARVFTDGEIVGRYAHGDWQPEHLGNLREVMGRLREQGVYDLDLVRRLLRCAFRMTEVSHGALFLLGDADAVLERSDAPEISHIAWIERTPIDELSDEELITFARQDGATVIDLDGTFRSCMVLLRPHADTVADTTPGRGARHSSAAKMTAEVRCLAVTVSQDGPITLFEGGQTILTL